MSIPRLVSVLFCAGLLVLTGCSTPAPAPVATLTPTDIATPSVSPLPEAAFLTVEAADINGLSSDTFTDQSAHIHTIVPKIEGVDALNGALAAFAAGETTEYNATTAASTEHTFLTVGWETIGASPTVVGILQTSSANFGANVSAQQRTAWFDITEQKLVGVRELLTPAGITAAKEAVTAALKPHVDASSLESAMQLLDAGEPAVAFDKDGQIVIGFDEYAVAPGAFGAPMITVSGQTQTQLSDVGQRARDAALSPERIELATPPTPEPRANVDCTDVACVALTFDDGPSAATTPRLLDVLRDRAVPATFFALGSQVKARPDLAQRIVAEGHEIGNHTWSHRQLTGISPDEIRSEITRTTDIIREATSVTPTLMRPPYGARNAQVDAIAADLGLGEALWSVDTEDWKNHDVNEIISSAGLAKPGAIVLMHDIHGETVDAVPGVIDALSAKGYTFVTVSQLVGTVQPGARYFGTY